MGSIQVVQDVEPAVWIHERLWSWGREGVPVGAVIPFGFDAYARVFHPVGREDGSGERVRWATIAGENDRVVHHEMQLHLISARPGTEPVFEHGGRWPMDEGTAAALVAAVGRVTDPEVDCWFGLWAGYGGVSDLLGPAQTFGSAFSRSTGRDYFLLRGPLQAVPSFKLGWFFMPPNFWWPEDRSWCVATEIDFDWSYVGGSRELVDAVLEAEELEALETTLEARGDGDGDRRNR